MSGNSRQYIESNVLYQFTLMETFLSHKFSNIESFDEMKIDVIQIVIYIEKLILELENAISRKIIHVFFSFLVGK